MNKSLRMVHFACMLNIILIIASIVNFFLWIDNFFRLKGADFIANALKINNTLTFINLYGININLHEYIYIFISILIYFSVAAVGIVEKDVNGIANALKINKTLKEILLTGNFVVYLCVFFLKVELIY